MGTYPSCRYKQSNDPSGFDSMMVVSADEDQALGPGWRESPADFGVETCPGVVPDLDIAAKREKADPGSLGAVSAAAGTQAELTGPVDPPDAADPASEPKKPSARRSKA